MTMVLHPNAAMNELSEYTGLKVIVIRYQREKMKDYVRTERGLPRRETEGQESALGKE